MKVIICGAGKVGVTVAKQLLLDAENDITIIDYNEKNLIDVRNLDVKTICGLSSSPEILDRAGATYADMIICVTRSDEINMLTSHIAGTLFGVKLKIVRIRSAIYLEHRWSSHLYNKNVLSVDYIISPEIEAAKHVIEMLGNTGIKYNVPINNGDYNIISLIITFVFEGKKVCDIRKALQFAEIENFSICFIKRGNSIHFPNTETILEKGDEIYILSPNNEITNIIRCINGHASKLKKILVCGGGEIGFNIAKTLQERYLSVKVIESDEERCKFLSEKLSSSIVIHGNMQERDIIQECGSVDAIISVSGKDETNLFTTLIAKSLGIPECFTLIDEYNYYDVFRDLSLKNIINTRDITISKILNCIGERSLIKQETICDGTYSICEFIVVKHSPLNGLEVSKVSEFKMTVLCVIRNGILQEKPVEKFIDGDVIVSILPFQFISKLEEMVA